MKKRYSEEQSTAYTVRGTMALLNGGPADIEGIGGCNPCRTADIALD